MYIMYVMKIETKTDLYTTAKLVPKSFLLKPKALASLENSTENFNEVEE